MSGASPVWTREQLEIDRQKAITIFRNERMEEPLEDYLEAFDEYQGYIEELLETTVDLSQLESTALDVLTDRRLFGSVSLPRRAADLRGRFKSFGRSLLAGLGSSCAASRKMFAV